MSDSEDARHYVRLKATLYQREDPHLFAALVELDAVRRAQFHRFLVRHGLMFSGTPLLPLLTQSREIPDADPGSAGPTNPDTHDCVRLDLRMYKQEDPHLCRAFAALENADRPRFHRFLLRHGFLFAAHAPSITPQWLHMSPGSQPAIFPGRSDSPELVANTICLSGEVDF